MGRDRRESTTVRTDAVLSAVGDAIDMYVEYRDQHGRDHENAKNGAIGEFIDWLGTLCDPDIGPVVPVVANDAAPAWHDCMTTIRLAQRIGFDYHKEHWAARMVRGRRLQMPHFDDCNFEGCEDSRALIARVAAETDAIRDLLGACLAGLFQVKRVSIPPGGMTPSGVKAWNDACEAFRDSGVFSQLDEAVKRWKHLPGGNDAKETQG